jgi:septation ring formation regulator EzrA
MPDQSAVAFAEISGKFDQMMDKIETVKDKQEEMAEDIAKIKEAVYNPDQGLYARLRELESWKDTSSRLIWIIITSLTALTVATVYKMLW